MSDRPEVRTEISESRGRVDPLTVALCCLLAFVVLSTLVAVFTHTLTVKEATNLFLTVGTPVSVLTCFAVGWNLSRQ